MASRSLVCGETNQKKKKKESPAGTISNHSRERRAISFPGFVWYQTRILLDPASWPCIEFPAESDADNARTVSVQVYSVHCRMNTCCGVFYGTKSAAYTEAYENTFLIDCAIKELMLQGQLLYCIWYVFERIEWVIFLLQQSWGPLQFSRSIRPEPDKNVRYRISSRIYRVFTVLLRVLVFRALHGVECNRLLRTVWPIIYVHRGL